jgi:electron transport complex protein RnfE
MRKIFYLDDERFLILCLGLCPAIFVTTTFENGYLMGLMVLFVTVLSNIIIAVLNMIVKDKYILLISIIFSSLIVTILDYFISIYIANIYEMLGIYISLTAINYVVIYKALLEKKLTFKSTLNSSLKLGVNFALIISFIGLIREFLGNNTITVMDKISDITGYISVYKILPENDFIPNELFLSPAGAFLILGLLISIINIIRKDAVK